MAWNYREWYEKNSKELSEKRKKRYIADAKYREERKKLASAYYVANKKRPQPLDRKMIVSGGVEYVTIGKLAERINRSVQTIHGYHRKGVLPDPEAFDIRGWRLYTKEQTEAIEQAFIMFDQGSLASLKEVSMEITNRLQDTELEGYGG